VRNSTVAEADFDQWLAARASAAIVVPSQRGNGAHPDTRGVRVDQDRLAALATEILAAAIRMAALLEVAQQGRRDRSGTINRAEGAGNV